MLWFFFNVCLFFWERGKENVSRGGAQREGDKESEAGCKLWAISIEPDAGLRLTNYEIMTWTEVLHLTDWAIQAPPPPQNGSIRKGIILFHISELKYGNLLAVCSWANHLLCMRFFKEKIGMWSPYSKIMSRTNEVGDRDRKMTEPNKKYFKCSTWTRW